MSIEETGENQESGPSIDFYLKPGWAPIKREFIKPEKYLVKSEEKLDLNDRKRACKDENRDNFKKERNARICPNVIQPFSNVENFTFKKDCPYGDSCKLSHDLSEVIPSHSDTDFPCPVLVNRNICPSGVLCYWSSTHDSIPKISNDTTVNYNEDCDVCDCHNKLENNVKKVLRKKSYNFEASRNVLRNMKSSNPYESFNEMEKKVIDFSGKTYLAPLTTVGNLPFRRVCIDQGVDITCSEMAMATNLLKGLPREWALLKRHSSEKLFGIQLCGNFPDMMTKCCQLVEENCAFDFVDLNIGCPIDSVYNHGCGSAMMKDHKKLVTIVRHMDSVLKNASVTVKMRTGIYKDKNTAHDLIKELAKSKCTRLVTVHGRSREQRYSKLADWNYLKDCQTQLNDFYSQEPSSCPMRIFGNGDILSYEDYKNAIESSNVSGCMIARGALIKPWIFKEIKEQKIWDISSSERFDIIRDFVYYGLEHWGSDQRGVETTRKFLLEWLSFTHRYIPVGLLERLPQKINEPPPPYIGRDYKETLLSSNKSQDWLKITEMYLGKVKENFEFVPRHKANSYQVAS